MFGQRIGFLLSYLFFTAIFFGVLTFFEKLPEAWSVVHVAALTSAVTALGFACRRYFSL